MYFTSQKSPSSAASLPSCSALLCEDGDPGATSGVSKVAGLRSEKDQNRNRQSQRHRSSQPQHVSWSHKPEPRSKWTPDCLDPEPQHTSWSCEPEPRADWTPSPRPTKATDTQIERRYTYKLQESLSLVCVVKNHILWLFHASFPCHHSLRPPNTLSEHVAFPRQGKSLAG